MRRIRIYLCLIVIFIATLSPAANSGERWAIQPDGSIKWIVRDHIPHYDHVEMSGRFISAILKYGVSENGSFVLNRDLWFPSLRIIPNDTFGSLHRCLNWNPLNLLEVDGYSVTHEKVETISLDGILKVESVFYTDGGKIHVSRIFFPAPDHPALIEIYTIKNMENRGMTIEVPRNELYIITDAKKGINQSPYKILCQLNTPGTYYLKSGDSLKITAIDEAKRQDQHQSSIDVFSALRKREENIKQWKDNLVLESPDTVINTMFAFSKIRACESIFETLNGPMHSPGGGAYYAAIWANDQAEYINPYFPFIGYEYGNQSALNAFLLFAKFMNKAYDPIPSSIIAEGTDHFSCAGDRGDAAMIAYGASRYALARGKINEAKQLWPLIQWCLEYCRRKINADGVVSSQSDELEGRFPSGKANLNTSCLYYDALLSASYLNTEIGGRYKVSEDYRNRASEILKHIETYFSYHIDGYDTYAYYKGNDKLRAWICTPLVMGITKHAQGTIQALFSHRLWSDNGLLSQEGTSTYWDRSTLYALRGAFYVGETNKALKFFEIYSKRRLLEDHVPYAIEAWPEGSQRHLSAESGLYGRVITEGLFAIRPIGLRKFQITPRLPDKWDKMALRKIHAFQSCFDIEIYRKKDNRLKVLITSDGKKIINRVVKEGKKITVEL